MTQEKFQWIINHINKLAANPEGKKEFLLGVVIGEAEF